MWELDCEESWVLKNWCFWTVVLEKTLESPSDCKKIQPVHSEGDQPWVFFGRNDAKAETPVLWPPHVKSWLIGKDSDVWRDWGQEEKGMTEDEMAGWHHWLNGRDSEWTPGVGDGQEGLACCDSWGRKESGTTERLNWTELNWTHMVSHNPCMVGQLLWENSRSPLFNQLRLNTHSGSILGGVWWVVFLIMSCRPRCLSIVAFLIYQWSASSTGLNVDCTQWLVILRVTEKTLRIRVC